ncbi:hypothetical protein GCM10027091_28100 [Streptomyces daliensis]
MTHIPLEVAERETTRLPRWRVADRHPGLPDKYTPYEIDVGDTDAGPRAHLPPGMACKHLGDVSHMRPRVWRTLSVRTLERRFRAFAGALTASAGTRAASAGTRNGATGYGIIGA